MRSDPKWITAKWAGRCSQCGEPFAKGADVFWYPLGRVWDSASGKFSRDVLSGDCADFDEQQRNDAAVEQAQEDAYQDNEARRIGLI